jgi:hypothetical protein
MSCDYAVWSPEPRLSNTQAGALYLQLCEGEGPPASLPFSPAIAEFYAELTAEHPEIDEVSEEQLEDKDLCPWSCAFDRADRYVIMNCIWPKADYVGKLVESLAAKHGLAFYDPQSERVKYPGAAPNKPWWRLW